MTPSTAAAEKLADEGDASDIYQGVIILEWPAPQHREQGSGVLAAWKIRVHDAQTGEPILMVMRAEVHAPADNIVTADLTMLADEDGKPVFDGKPHVREGDDGPETLCGTFPFIVAEMRVREAAP